MRTTLSVVTLSTVILIYGGFSTLQNATDVMKQLGIPEEEAKDFVWWSFSGGSFSFPNKPQLKQTPVSERAALVQQICAFAKSYTESAAFKEKYLEYREGLKPSPPEKPEPMDQMRARLKKELEQSIQETEKNISSMPAEYHEMMKANVDMMKEQVKAYDDPENPMFSKDMEKMQLDMYEAQVVEHKKQLAEWEKANPQHPQLMVKTWLEGFLKESKDIDFSAKLVDGEYGKKVFANREYEMKSGYWKLGYRAGKESMDAARGFIKGWLDELNKK